jgi:purine-binding chemotaxis protein CheW
MAAVALKTEERQFVTLGIDREVFAVPVETVLEILDMRPMFRIPDAPAHLSGLIDLRGRSVPVIDLRLRLGLPQAPVTESTRILVLETPVKGRALTLGLIADRVFEVTGLDDDAIEAAPDIGSRWRSDHIRGVGRRNDGFVVVFDLARLFSADGDVLLDAGRADLEGDREGRQQS